MEVLTTRTSQSLLHFPPSGNGTQRDRLNPLIVILGDRKSWAYLIGLLSFFNFLRLRLFGDREVDVLSHPYLCSVAGVQAIHLYLEQS